MNSFNATFAPFSPYEKNTKVPSSELHESKDLRPSFSSIANMLPSSSSGFSFSKHMSQSRILLCFTAVFFLDFSIFIYTGITDSQAISPTMKVLIIICALAVVMAIPIPVASDDDDEDAVFGGYADLFSDLTGKPTEKKPALRFEDYESGSQKVSFISIGDEKRKEVLPVITIKPADVSGYDHDSAASASDCDSPGFGDSSASDCSSPSFSPWSDSFPDPCDRGAAYGKLSSPGRRS